MAKNKFDKKDASKETNATPKQVSDAWHVARNDCAGTWGVPTDRHSDKEVRGNESKDKKAGNSGDSSK
ncbi:MAG: hypothetical protein WCO21_02400 [bacterium]|nr:hypothetical protein [Candidatus Jorgensenbacteria bacterium]